MSSADVFTQFINKPREYVVVNSADEPIEIAYAAMTRAVPPVSVANPPDAEHPHAFSSYVDSEGNVVPGTLVVKDIYTPEGKLEWDAQEAIKHSLGIDPRSGTAESPSYRKGLTILGGNFTEEELHNARRKGRDRYEHWRIEAAKAVVESYDGRNEKRKQLGMNEISGGLDYMKAATILQVAAEKERAAAEVTLAAFRKAEAGFDEDLVSFARRRIGEIAVAAAQPGEDSAKLAETLAADPAMIAKVEGEFVKKGKKR